MEFLRVARGHRFRTLNRYASQNARRRESHEPLRCLSRTLQILLHFELVSGILGLDSQLIIVGQFFHSQADFYRLRKMSKTYLAPA